MFVGVAVVMRMIVGAFAGGVSVDVDIAQDRVAAEDVVAEEFAQHGGREALGAVVVVDAAGEAGDTVAAGGDGAEVV